MLQLFNSLGILLICLSQTSALECYACSYTLYQSDATCLTNASAGRVINCNKKYCLTVRQEMIHNANKVTLFIRDCQDKPLMLNEVKTDATFRTYYRSCQQKLCNGHNGKVYNSSGSAGAAAAAGGNHNVIIPGKNSGQTEVARINSFVLSLILLLCLL